MKIVYNFNDNKLFSFQKWNIIMYINVYKTHEWIGAIAIDCLFVRIAISLISFPSLRTAGTKSHSILIFPGLISSPGTLFCCNTHCSNWGSAPRYATVDLKSLNACGVESASAKCIRMFRHLKWFYHIRSTFACFMYIIMSRQVLVQIECTATR